MFGPFLTQIDSRAEIRGSRDPLSLVPIWASFGRLVVGNLTTASTSLRGFTTVLLGYYMADRVQEQTPDETPLNTFLRVEQLVAYCRTFVNKKDTDYRGSVRVKKRLEDSNRVTLSAEPRHQILGDQKTYGLWGLYSVASRTSGFLLPDRPALTPEAIAFVESEYIPRLSRAGVRVDGLTGLVGSKTKELDLGRSSSNLAEAIARLHSERIGAQERQVYQDYIVDGGREQNTDGQQRILAGLLDRVDSHDFQMADLQRVIKLARTSKEEQLASRLNSIQRLESVIVPAANLFSFLLRCDGRTLDAVRLDVRGTWGKGLKNIGDGLSDAVEADVVRVAHAPEAATALGRFGRFAAAGDWGGAIEGLVEFNTFVMKRRGGAPWVRVEKDRIKVDYHEEGRDIASTEDLAQPWENTYFINALHGIKRELGRN